MVQPGKGSNVRKIPNTTHQSPRKSTAQGVPEVLTVPRPVPVVVVQERRKAHLAHLRKAHLASILLSHFRKCLIG